MARSLRTRLERSPLLAAVFARLAAGWLRLCFRTTRWQVIGGAALDAALAEGPVIVLLWHSRLMLAPAVLERAPTTFATLNDTSPIGRLTGEMMRRFAMEPVPMSARRANRAASRGALAHLKAGHSLGLTGDGPLGPARVLKPAALDWARVAGVPIFVFAVATTRQRRLATWDRLMLPLPFGRGAYGYARWDGVPPRRPSEAEQAALLAAITETLDRHQEAVDRAAGVAPGP